MAKLVLLRNVCLTFFEKVTVVVITIVVTEASTRVVLLLLFLHNLLFCQLHTAD
jgi:hypothetical protein